MSLNPAPPLTRWVRGLRWLSVLLVVLLVAGLGAVGYSASKVRPSIESASSNAAMVTANGTVEANASVQVENPGYFSFSRVSLSVDLVLPSGELFSRSASPSVSIPGGTLGVVPISLTVPASELETHTGLLTNDTVLNSFAWFNATYADAFPISVFETGNYSWGAPFANLTFTPSVPAAEPNGTVSETVGVEFANHASFADVGHLQFEVVGSSGEACGSGILPMNVPAGGTFDQSVDVISGPSCVAGGVSVVSTFVGNGFSFSLPTEAVP